MRVDELKNILNLSPHTIKLIGNDATHYLIANQKQTTINKVKKYACEKGVAWNKTHQQSINTLIERMSYRNIYNILELEELGINKPTVSHLLIEIGKELNQKHKTIVINKNQEKYGYSICLPEIFIWINEKDEKIKINLNDLAITKEKQSQFQSKTSNNQFSILPKFFNNSKINDSREHKAQFEEIANQLGHKNNLKSLQNLAKKIDYSILLDVIGRLEGDEKQIMMNTYVEIGKEFNLPGILQSIVSLFRTKYKKKKKEEKNHFARFRYK